MDGAENSVCHQVSLPQIRYGFLNGEKQDHAFWVTTSQIGVCTVASPHTKPE